MMSILIKPIVTEKQTTQTEKYNRYAFVVTKNANKYQIKNEVEKMYKVTVQAVNTVVYNGKIKSRHTKSGLIKGKTKSYKKAIVTLIDGNTIDFYSNV